MNINFEKLSKEHQIPAMKIYNYYVETTTSAFPSEPMPDFMYIGMHYRKNPLKKQ